MLRLFLGKVIAKRDGFALPSHENADNFRTDAVIICVALSCGV
jgi:hypothetical protein